VTHAYLRNVIACECLLTLVSFLALPLDGPELIVLIDPEITEPTPDENEPDSQTAERWDGLKRVWG
jgi:hypothetical protein